MLNIAQKVFSQMWTFSIVCMITLFHATNGVTLQDLKHFLHTYQKVWTHTRSFEVGPPQHRHRCIYAEIRLTEHGRYVYAQHYEVDFQWISQLFYAQIFESHKRPVLRIKRRTGKPKCEMQVCDDRIQLHVPACRMAYKSHCARGEFPIYTRQCSPPRKSKLESQILFTR
uniref:Lipocalin n=1 Tax=Rhipicephalus zambeziensis TaxID=60191 RepID=A0A224YDT0_9ACAR